jgi:hypothetical protein
MTPGFALRLSAVEAYALGDRKNGDRLYRAALAADAAGASIIGGPLLGRVATTLAPVEERAIQTVVRDVAKRSRDVLSDIFG